MLEKLDAERKLIKLGTSEVMMTPNNTDNIRLDELNLELDKIEVPEVQNQEPPKMVDDVVPGDEIKPSSVSTVRFKPLNLLYLFSIAITILRVCIL